MSKILKIIIICLTMINLKNISFSISENFKFVINTIGIPQYNVYNEEINEEIYYKYNSFVYSYPEKLIGVYGQRFKNIINGKWKRNGVNGEYYFLGRNYSGNLVANVNFPVDGMPETTPEKWKYLYLSNALSSWENINFRSLNQKEYMINSKILFDDIKDNNINSYNLVEYDITPLQIGLNKIVMNTPSTWHTKGVLTVKRKALNGKIYTAIFASRPMAVNAKIQSYLKCPNDIVLSSNDNYCTLDINYGAIVNGLNKYANKDDIKEIVSILYINGKEVSKISKIKSDVINKNEVISFSRNNYNIAKTYPLNIKIKSYLYTKFSVDGLLQNEISKNINLKVENIKSVRSSNLFTVCKENDDLYYLEELPKTRIAINGIIENNRYLGIKINKNINSNFKYEIFINGKKCKYEKIYNSKNYDILKLKINEKNTLNTWNYLRNIKGNYFNIDFDLIGKRIRNKNVIEIKCTNERIVNYFDTIDDFKINYNYIFNNVINNKLNKFYLDNVYD